MEKGKLINNLWGVIFLFAIITTSGCPPFDQHDDGNKIPDNSKSTPTQKSVYILAGYYHNIVIKSDGTGWAWGDNEYGQLGNGNTGTNQDTPVQVLNIDNIKATAGGRHHSIALKNDGTAWTWGRNHRGQLGNGNTGTDQDTPVQVLNIDNIKAIAGGRYHSIALKNNGTIWTWGYNNLGQLGNGTQITKNTPVQVLNIDNAKAIAGGNLHSIALKNDETIWTWGNNEYGQLGNGNTGTHQNTPVQVLNINNVKAIAGGADYCIATKNDGSVWTWGHNNSGQLGNGNIGINQDTPVQVLDKDGNGFINLNSTLIVFKVMLDNNNYPTLKWETRIEKNRKGFYIWRSYKKSGKYKKINNFIIHSKGGETWGASYSYTDVTALKEVNYYKLENKNSQLFYGPVKIERNSQR